jgi:thiol-disulfide isomerase/thioredoxin
MVKSKKRVSKLKTAFAYLLLMIALSIAVDLWRSQSMVSGNAPELISTSIQGENIDLIAMSQKRPVLVYFWGTWCAVCRTVSPSVNFLSDYYQTVTIALRSGKAERVQLYQTAKNYQFSTVNDPKGSISRSWGVSVTPTLFVVDKGKITFITTGFTSPIGMWLRLIF